MDLLYAVFPKQQPILNHKTHLVSTSSTNIVAFTTCLNISKKPGICSEQFRCYIVDLNTPWLPIEVHSGSSITAIEWDKTGKYLLVADIGTVRIFSSKECFNEWQEVQNAKFPGEIILRAAFFENGTHVQFNFEKDAQSYYEKYNIVKNRPALANFGGVSRDGCIVVTASGMIGAFTIGGEPDTSKVVTESLGVTRNLYTMADITFTKDGQALVAASNIGKANNVNMVRCFRIKVTQDKLSRELSVISRAMPSFFLTEGHGHDLPDLKLAKLRWTSQDSILVATNYMGGSYVEMWNLQEKTMSIHKVFQNNKGDVFRTQCWQNLFYSRFPAKIKDFCLTKVRVFPSDVIFVVLNDSTLHCLIKDSLKVTYTTHLSYGNPTDSGDHSPVKQNKISICPDSIDITALGHNVILIDKGQIHVYGVSSSVFFSSMNPMSNAQQISYVGNLLEYSMVAAVDYLDVILATRINSYDAIIERINENFNRQPHWFQQFYYVRFLTLKTNLYRFSPHGHGMGKAHDLSCLLILHSILIAFKNLLRPSDLTSQDKGPSENLAMVLSESNVDIDKVLLKLDAKDFAVEKSTLQSLQQLIQWVADLTLSILFRLPENRVNHNRGGYDISKDIVALNSIRELLVMIRMWGLLKSQCLPVFCRFSDNCDVLATIYRLLTKLALNPNEPDDMLLDECCLLPNQVSIPNLPVVSQKAALVSAVLNHVPVFFEYNCEPDNYKHGQESPYFSNNSSTNLMDSIRHLQLGKKPHTLRKCLRCSAVSGTGIIGKSAAMKSWEQRWQNECRCGGYWRLQSA